MATKHWKIDIDMQQVANAQDMQAILNATKPNALETFVGLRYLMVRYADSDTAYARALDAECAAYCGRVGIEEVNA